MPIVYKDSLLSSSNDDQLDYLSTKNNPPKKEEEEEELLPSPLDTPELPPPDLHLEPQSAFSEKDPDPLPESPRIKPKKTKMIEVAIDDDEEDEDTEPIKTFITWQAPARPYRKKSRSFYTTVAVLVVLISLIALLAGQIMLLGAVLAFVFLVYVLNFTEPHQVSYKITSQGITVEDHFYHWQELDSFWFDQKEGFPILHILTHLKFPGMLILVLEPGMEEKLKRICVKYLPYHEIAPKTFIDRWSDSLQKHFPLETPHH